MNTLKTGFLLTALTLIVIFAGGALGGPQGVKVAFIFACIMNVIAYWFSDRIVLSMYRAQPVSEQDAPQLYSIVRELSTRAQLPLPKIYVIPSENPNAFATGRDPAHAAVAVTQGILRLLSREELTGVLGHELAHVQNRDTLTMTVVATLAGVVSMLARRAQWGMLYSGRGRNRNSGQLLSTIILMIVAPLAALIIQLAISRSREFAADERGARVAGSAQWLASALEKLSTSAARLPMRDAEPATAHLFIVNPLSGGGIASLFSTHPPVAERVERLRAMGF